MEYIFHPDPSAQQSQAALDPALATVDPALLQALLKPGFADLVRVIAQHAHDSEVLQQQETKPPAPQAPAVVQLTSPNTPDDKGVPMDVQEDKSGDAQQDSQQEVAPDVEMA